MKFRGKILVAGIGLCAALVAAAATTSPVRSLIFPGSRSQGEPRAIIRPGIGEELTRLVATDGVGIRALFGRPLDARGQPLTEEHPRPTILFFYGNAMCMADCLGIFDEVRHLGYNVVLADYEGYGMSDGDASESGCDAAADAAYRFASTRPDVDMHKMIAAGLSLGSAVAIDLGSRRPVAGVIAIGAFTNLSDAGRQISPALTDLLISDKAFDNLGKIPLIPCPIMLVNGTLDQLTTPQMADRLQKAATVNVFRVQIAGAGHNDLISTGGARLMWQIKQFVDELPPVKMTSGEIPPADTATTSPERQ